jgi:hypothetical protein
MQSNTSFSKTIRTKPKAEAFKRPQSALKGQDKRWIRETQKSAQNSFKRF